MRHLLSKSAPAAVALILGMCATWTLAQQPGKSRIRNLVREYFTSTDTAKEDSPLANTLGMKTGVESVVALEYTVLQLTPEGEVAVDPSNKQFNIGDKIRVKIEPLEDLYIYIFHEGPTGEQTCLLPTSNEKPPLARAHKPLVLPADGYLKFSPPPGDEKLIVVAAEQPINDLTLLASVVFKKPDQELTPEEKQVKAKLKASGQQMLKSIREQQAQGSTFRGILSPEAEKKLAAKTKSRAMVEEPPHGDKKSTFAMAASAKGSGKPSLLVSIPLRSVGN